MKKILLVCSALILLAGCTSKPPVQGAQPEGVLTLDEKPSGGLYVDMRSVSAFKGDTTLRRFYIISHYNDVKQVREKPPLYIASSQFNNVIDCVNKKRTHFGRIYYSKFWAEGKRVASRNENSGEWSDYPADSVIGQVADQVCEIPVKELSREPAEDSGETILGELE